MKKAIGIVCLFLLVVVFAFFSSCKSKNQLEEPVHKGNLTYDSIKNDYTQLYTIDSIPANLDTVEFVKTIILNPQKKRHILLLPHAGTITDIVISDTSFYPIKENAKADIFSEGSFYMNEPVLLDISKLQKRKYHIHILGCSTGGVFVLAVK